MKRRLVDADEADPGQRDEDHRPDSGIALRSENPSEEATEQARSEPQEQCVGDSLEEEHGNQNERKVRRPFDREEDARNHGEFQDACDRNEGRADAEHPRWLSAAGTAAR